jgi:hypothetical protein
MKTHSKFILLIGALFFVASACSAQAAIRIYKVTFKATALLNPKANSFLDVGYVIYDSANPGNSQTVEIFKNKTYQINGGMLARIVPSQVALGALDTNADAVADTEAATVGFQSGGLYSARSYIGKIPPAGIRVGIVTVVLTAKSLKGQGEASNLGVNSFAISDTWTFDTLSVTGNPANTAAGVLLVQALLQGKGYTQIP